MELGILSIWFAIILISFNGKNGFCDAAGSETTIEDAEECVNPTGKFGICIPLLKCKKLFAILKENPLQLDRLKFLQKSTCNFKGDDPWVCCESNSGQEEEVKPKSTGRPKPRPKPKTPTTTTTIPPPPPPPPEDDTNSNEIKDHPNRSLLPDSRTCGNSLLSDRIIGGTAAGLGTYPWMALLAFNDGSGDIQYACGGTIINSRYILTASHCVTNLPGGFRVSFVRLGEYERKKNPDCVNGLCAPKIQDIPVAEIIPHEKFDATGRTENDIALLRLQREISLSAFTTPICLPQGNILRHKLVNSNGTYVAGWGRTKLNSDVGSDLLQHVHVPVITTKDCNAYYSKQKIGNIDETKFCAGSEKGKDSCQGDSGGPIMETIFNEKLLEAQTWQFGIVSLGPSPCGSANPALYTNVTHYVPWILDHLKP